MTNWDIEAAWHYHNGTKHPDGYLMNPGHRFDPMQQLELFKTYTDLKPIPLSVDVSTGSVPALAAISSDAVHAGDQRIPDVHMLARVLYFSATSPPAANRVLRIRPLRSCIRMYSGATPASTRRASSVTPSGTVGPS